MSFGANFLQKKRIFLFVVQQEKIAIVTALTDVSVYVVYSVM